jgi:hypothetical protein
MTMTTATAIDAARIASLAEITHAARGDLSLRARLGYVLLLLIAVAGAGALLALWVTEPGLPLRTHLAFGGLLGILLGWASFAAWVLRTRRPLFGRDRVVAGRLAVTFSSLFAVGMAAAGATTGRPGPWGGAVLGAVMVVVAAWLLRRAGRRVVALTARRDALSRQLDVAGSR